MVFKTMLRYLRVLRELKITLLVLGRHTLDHIEERDVLFLLPAVLVEDFDPPAIASTEGLSGLTVRNLRELPHPATRSMTLLGWDESI